MQDFNIHAHTTRCGHAVGDDRDHIESAIESGFKVLGFSEHMGFEDWDDEGERVNFKDMLSYEEAIRSYSEEYQEIEIYLGYEGEYFPDIRDYYFEVRDRVDYLILGQHSLARDEVYFHNQASDKEVRLLAERVEEALETGLFTYLCHPDYFMQARDTYSKDCDLAFKEMAQSCKKHGVPMELNLNGYLRRRSVIDGVDQVTYPFKKAWETIADVGPMVIVGYDSHAPEHLSFRGAEDQLLKEYEDFNFKYASLEDLINFGRK